MAEGSELRIAHLEGAYEQFGDACVPDLIHRGRGDKRAFPRSAPKPSLPLVQNVNLIGACDLGRLKFGNCLDDSALSSSRYRFIPWACHPQALVGRVQTTRSDTLGFSRSFRVEQVPVSVAVVDRLQHGLYRRFVLLGDLFGRLRFRADRATIEHLSAHVPSPNPKLLVIGARPRF